MQRRVRVLVQRGVRLQLRLRWQQRNGSRGLPPLLHRVLVKRRAARAAVRGLLCDEVAAGGEERGGGAGAGGAGRARGGGAAGRLLPAGVARQQLRKPRAAAAGGALLLRSVPRQRARGRHPGARQVRPLLPPLPLPRSTKLRSGGGCEEAQAADGAREALLHAAPLHDPRPGLGQAHDRAVRDHRLQLTRRGRGAFCVHSGYASSAGAAGPAAEVGSADSQRHRHRDRVPGGR
mmetsp:Transcript_19532/g.74964  ORF Transcript_19532/g.74964 Transcript_19532/m.74964 type:complete len:234 (-) Transcript_19532:1605-2306(-)